MCKRIIFFATALVLIGLAASGFTSTSSKISWSTGGKNVLILGAATPLALDFTSPHEWLRLPTEAAFASTVEDRIRRADALFIDECQFANAAAFAEHPFVQAAVKVGTPIVLENASADAVSGLVGAGFGGAVVVLQTVNETTAQLTIIQEEEHLEEQIQKALVKADAFRLKHAAMPVGDGDILPNYSKRTIYADIASPVINFQRKLCQDEEALDNAQSQSGQLDVGVKIDLYAFMEAKIAVFSATGSGIYAGQHLIRNDDQFRGIFMDSAYFQLAHNGPELQFTHTAPINAMASETVNTQTSFGIASGPKGVPIPTFNKTTTITQTLDAFGVFNRSSSNQASWGYKMQLLKNGDKYNTFDDAYQHIFEYAAHVYEPAVWATETMPIQFQAVAKASPTYMNKTNVTFTRFFRGVSLHHWSSGLNPYTCTQTYPYSYHDQLVLDFSTVFAYHLPQAIATSIHLGNISGDLTAYSSKGFYFLNGPEFKNTGQPAGKIRYHDFDSGAEVWLETKDSWLRIDANAKSKICAINTNLELSLLELGPNDVKNGKIVGIVPGSALPLGDNAVDVSMGPGGFVYFLDKGGLVFKIADDGTGKTQLPTTGLSKSFKANRITVAANEKVYILSSQDGSDGEIHEYDPGTQKWKDTGGLGVDLDAAGNNVLAIDSNKDVVLYDDDHETWVTRNSLSALPHAGNMTMQGIATFSSASPFIIVGTKYYSAYRVPYKQ